MLGRPNIRDSKISKKITCHGYKFHGGPNVKELKMSDIRM